jgi:hypothetical protein
MQRLEDKLIPCCLNAGLTDVWSSLEPNSSGFTWPLSGELPSVLLNPSRQLDLVLARGAISFSDIDVVGEDIADLTHRDFVPPITPESLLLWYWIVGTWSLTKSISRRQTSGIDRNLRRTTRPRGKRTLETGQ